MLSDEFEVARASDEILEEFHKRQESAKTHHVSKVTRIKLREVQEWFLSRGQKLEGKKAREERLRRQKLFYEAFKTLEQQKLIMSAPGSADEWFLTNKADHVTPHYVLASGLEEKYRSMETRWNWRSLQTKIAGPASLLWVGSLFAILLTATWAPVPGVPGSYSFSASQWTPVVTLLFFGGFAAVILTSLQPLTKEDTAFARLYRAYRFANEERFKEAVDELDRVSKGLIFFTGYKTNWTTVDSQLRTMFADLGNSVRRRLLPVVDKGDPAAVAAVVPNILATAEAFTHLSPERLREANEDLLELVDKGPYKPPTGTEKLVAHVTPARFLIITAFGALALSIAVFWFFALVFGKAPFEYEDVKLVALSFATALFSGLVAVYVSLRK